MPRPVAVAVLKPNPKTSVDTTGDVATPSAVTTMEAAPPTSSRGLIKEERGGKGGGRGRRKRKTGSYSKRHFRLK